MAMANKIDASERIVLTGDHATRITGKSCKVLVIDEELPLPANSGKKIRTWNLLRSLAQRHDITLLCYGETSAPEIQTLEEAGLHVQVVPPRATPSKLGLLRRLFLNLFSALPYSVVKHHSQSFQAALDELLLGKNWDLLQVEWTPYMSFVSRKMPCPVVLATHNVECQIWARRAGQDRNPFRKLFFYLQAVKMRRFEKAALTRAACVSAVSKDDARIMESWGRKEVQVVSNGADLESYRLEQEKETANRILSISSLDWFPNIDALNFFVRDIWPIIRSRRSAATFQVIGRNPPASLRERLADSPGVVFVGEVNDVRAYIQSAAVLVVPLRIGGGSRLKILEALASCKAVVSTTIGAEGLELQDGMHISIADQPLEFAAKVVELLDSPSKRRQLGQAGRARVVERYDWKAISKSLESLWQSAAARSQQTALTEPWNCQLQEAP
jgi:glycosyltransferase involved in cell wall biosynthesis